MDNITTSSVSNAPDISGASNSLSPPNGKKKEHPIVSYGIICFVLVTNSLGTKTPKYLIYQRRDNYEYIDILRGNWSNEDRFRVLASSLSRDEKERLMSYTFKELWDDLWIIHNSKIHTDGYERALRKYESIRPKLHGILNDIASHPMSDLSSDPPWGFPKGKKLEGHRTQERESDIECALREFTEETRLSTQDMICWNIHPFSETYRGNNNKVYSTYYYLAESKQVLDIEKLDTPHCIRQTALSEESETAEWKTFAEACLKLNPRRQTILKKVHHLIETRYSDFSPFEMLPPPGFEEM